jgi:hypothetical protein
MRRKAGTVGDRTATTGVGDRRGAVMAKVRRRQRVRLLLCERCGVRVARWVVVEALNGEPLICCGVCRRRALRDDPAYVGRLGSMIYGWRVVWSTRVTG